jgi:hypothetical protein
LFIVDRGLTDGEIGGITGAVVGALIEALVIVYLVHKILCGKSKDGGAEYGSIWGERSEIGSWLSKWSVNLGGRGRAEKKPPTDILGGRLGLGDEFIGQNLATDRQDVDRVGEVSSGILH